MDLAPLDVTLADGTTLNAARRPGDGPTVVFLHAGVADLRSWETVIAEPALDGLDLIAYDRRGFGSTPSAADPAGFAHLDDLWAVFDAAEVERAVLVGNSMGGALAIDATLAAPERVSSVLLLAAGVSGMTDEDTSFDWTPDPATGALLEALEAATKAGDVEQQVRLLAHLWLDGPTQPEGRVPGAPRNLFLDMNRDILAMSAPDSAGDAAVDAWTRLDTIAVPVLAAWGDLDMPPDLPFYAETARRLGQGPGRVLPGVAHLPGLEEPTAVAGLVGEVVRT